MKNKNWILIIFVVALSIYVVRNSPKAVISTETVATNDQYGAANLKTLKHPQMQIQIQNQQTSQPEKKPHQNQNLSIVEIIKKEALLLDRLDNDPDFTEKRLRKMALSLNLSELEILQNAAVYNNNQNESTIATYLLTLAGPKAQQSLIKVFTSTAEVLNQPAQAHTIEEIKTSHEYAIRSMALEAIEANLHQTHIPLGREVKTENLYLNGLLKIVKLGEKTDQPLLKKFIDGNINTLAGGH